MVAFGSFVAFIVAYHTYGRWLARKIFRLDPKATVPSKQLRDDVDFVPTKVPVLDPSSEIRPDDWLSTSPKTVVVAASKPTIPLLSRPLPSKRRVDTP